MSSLHSRRPPILEQGEIRRGEQRGVDGGGGGTLRQPPRSSGREDLIGDIGSKGHDVKKKKMSRWRMIMSLIVLILLALLFEQMRFMFGARVVKSRGSGLRAKQDAVSHISV